MLTDQQVRGLRVLVEAGQTQEAAAAKLGMDRKTARKYLRMSRLPSEMRVPHNWRTRPDPFAEVWREVQAQLQINVGLEGRTLFDWLQRQYPGRFTDGQLRTLQRHIKAWRATDGPPKEVFFAQVHRPGVLCQSDFTHMTSLGVTIAGRRFEHLIYHFVLTYSNWETFTVCFSESFESLSEGLQKALWELGGVPACHRTDRMSLAVCNGSELKEFTQRYQALLDHYGLAGQKIQAGKAHENGDVEQSHHRFKVAVDQALMLRGSRDFVDRNAYVAFLVQIQDQRNAGRAERLAEELVVLRALPQRRLESFKRCDVSVDRGSLIRVDRNVYSVNSRLIGEKVRVHLYAEHLEVWYGQNKVDQLPRLRGRRKHRVQYRHVIDWLVRKPGAFENYRYREDLFPTTHFRMAYDGLRQACLSEANAAYLQILHLAARESETDVDQALRQLIQVSRPITPDAVAGLIRERSPVPAVTEVHVDQIDLSSYDLLCTEQEAA